MLQAKVKPEYRYGPSLQALSRHEFIKSEWRDVPTGFEDEARAHEWLEVRERPVVEPGAIETVAPAPVVEPDEPAADQQTDEGAELPTSEQLLDKLLGEDEEGEPVEPTSEQLLEKMLEDEPGEPAAEEEPEAEQPEEEVKATRRGRGGKKKP